MEIPQAQLLDWFKRRGAAMKVLMATFALILVSYSVALGAPTAGVYYYPWWGTFSGGHSFNDTLRAHLIPAQGPALGQYSSRSSDVIAAHIDQSHRGNIGLWVLSWWGPTSPEDSTIRDHVFAHPRAGELKLAIHYESTGRLGSFNNPDFSSLVPDFRYLAQNYFDRPNYLRIDGRPVVVMYLTRVYFNSAASRDAIASVRQTIQNEYGYDPYIVGDDFFTGGVDLGRAELWDAITNFDVYGTVLQSNGSTTSALNALAQIYDDAKTAASSIDVGFIPTASPGFNDKGVRGGHPAAPRYLDGDPTAAGSLFSEMLSDVVVPRVDERADNILLINSFNEWHEDTQIEASNIASPTNVDDSGAQEFTEGNFYTGYGDLYLDLLCAHTGAGTGLLFLSPASGKYFTTQGFDLNLILEVVSGPEVSVVGGSATFDGGDATAALRSCIIPGTLVSGGQTFRCPGLSGAFLGTGTHTLAVTLDLSDGTSTSDTVIWEVVENTEP